MNEHAALRRVRRGGNAGKNGSRRGIPGWALALLLGILAGHPGVATAGEIVLHEVTWGHPSPAQVSRFVVFVSRTRGDANGARQVEVGKPATILSGTLQVYSAIVPVDHEEFVAIGAVDSAGNLGAMSSWSAVPPSRPGQPLLIEP